MLCKVAQVFRARGGRPIVLFTSPFSGEESSYVLTIKVYMHTFQFLTHSAATVLIILQCR